MWLMLLRIVSCDRDLGIYGCNSSDNIVNVCTYTFGNITVLLSFTLLQIPRHWNLAGCDLVQARGIGA